MAGLVLRQLLHGMENSALGKPLLGERVVLILLGELIPLR
jgi:hypothetical protein